MKFGWPFSFSVLKVKTTSSAVIGVPSANFASGRSLNTTDLLVGGHVAAFGDEPVDRVRLVLARAIRLSNRYSSPCAASPLRMKLLKLSNVLTPPVPVEENLPPFGASGIDVVEVLEVGGVLQLAERRKPVARLGVGGHREQRRGDGECGEAGEDRGAGCGWHGLRPHPHCPRAPASAFCLSASNHQTCDSAEVCDGNVAGRPNTSQ